MSQMDELRSKIETERLKLDQIVEKGVLTEESYKQSLIVDELMKQYIELKAGA